MIGYKRIDSPRKVADYISGILHERLARKEKVLWLLPGGSAADIAVDAANQISRHPNLGLLNVSLTDERYGVPGHADSNWKLLIDKGLNLPDARIFPVLNGKDFKTTAENYAGSLNEILESCDYSLALGGMGPDGHIFGIKPHSPAVDTTKDVLAYVWDDYKRLTLTMNFIRKLDEVVIYAVGDEKQPQFDLLEREISPEKQPAQLLKQLPRVTIFNDYKGDRL